MILTKQRKARYVGVPIAGRFSVVKVDGTSSDETRLVPMVRRVHKKDVYEQRQTDLWVEAEAAARKQRVIDRMNSRKGHPWF